MTNISRIHEAFAAGNGPAQACHYTCTIYPPKPALDLPSTMVAKGAMNLYNRILSFLTESVSLPGRQLLTTEQKIFGTLRKVPYGVNYEDITITFICTNMMWERAFFDAWHNFIISPASQYMEYYEDYVGEIIIAKVTNDEGGLPLSLATYRLIEAYPVSIQAQDLSYDNTDILKLTVQFAYARWHSSIELIGIADGPPQLGNAKFANLFAKGTLNPE